MDGAQEATVRRLFIGNISAELCKTPEDLRGRIAKFGALRSEFDLHFNEVRQTAFGYLQVELTEKDLVRLKNALNGLKYKGAKLVIDEAKPTFTKRWEIDAARPDGMKAATLRKTEWSFHKKIENINMSYKDRQEIIPGRLRAKPRKGVKLMTLRVSFNGTVKTIKCHKTKLWGYEKNKRLRDLVYKYNNSVWKDGNDHIVERVTQMRLTQGANRLTIQRMNERDDDKLLHDAIDEEEDAIEVEKQNKVLASVLGNFDFDKPLDYYEETGEFAGSDFEYNKSDLESDEETHGMKPVDLNEIEYVKEGEFGKSFTNDVHYDEEDDGEDEDKIDVDDEIEEQVDVKDHIDEDDKLNTQEVQDEESAMDVDLEAEEEDGEEDQDLEFMPTFGQKTEPTQEVASTLVSGTVSNTETLRTLFNEDQGAQFNLIEESDEDIDKTKQPVHVDIELPEQHIASIAPKIKHRKGLFFPHFDSPFLVAQTQLNKLNSATDLGEWDTSFWEQRSEWTSEFKRRKRDVLRQMRKKNAKNSRVFV